MWSVLPILITGDHVEWNSEAGLSPRDDQEEADLQNQLQGIHRPRFRGGATVFGSALALIAKNTP
jgi:hypothetical protein